MAVGDIFSGIGSLFEAQGSEKEAQLFNQAATVGKEEIKVEAASGGIQQQAERRQIYQAVGQNVAAAGGGNLSTSGSALDVLRSSQQQGALQVQLTGAQTGIQEFGTQLQVISAQAQAAEAQATAAAQAGSGIGGILGGVSKLFSLF